MLRVLGAFRQKTDYRRWSRPRNIYESWATRTQRAAELIPAGSRVIEFGAGKRVLERELDPSCTYVPSDLVDRGPGTFVADLNERPLPELGADTYDVAVFMGVLEYLRDVPGVISWLARQVPMCVVSYACADTDAGAVDSVRSKFERLHHGWMNNFTEDQLCRMFRDGGYVMRHVEAWENQRLFVFSLETFE
ncbi:class I SAM-dependent methyltransferase [Mycolicibacterium vaccae]|uniref:class I SAM-dependent methyltransferase n=1 Tax=Mycolicibacterium vaccae TaxID=1810 RepID=UPI003CFF5C49